MLVFPDGRTVGTIGGGCYENDAFWKAKDAIQSRKPQLVKYDLNDDFAQENGLVCGGQMQVYIEPLEATPQLYVIGTSGPAAKVDSSDFVEGEGRGDELAPRSLYLDQLRRRLAAKK